MAYGQSGEECPFALFVLHAIRVPHIVPFRAIAEFVPELVGRICRRPVLEICVADLDHAAILAFVAGVRCRVVLAHFGALSYLSPAHAGANPILHLENYRG